MIYTLFIRYLFKYLSSGVSHHYQESSSFKTLAGTVATLKISKPLWALLENVDLGDPSDNENSNASMVRQALDDAGYASRITSAIKSFHKILLGCAWYSFK